MSRNLRVFPIAIGTALPSSVGNQHPPSNPNQLLRERTPTIMATTVTTVKSSCFPANSSSG